MKVYYVILLNYRLTGHPDKSNYVIFEDEKVFFKEYS